MNRDLSTDAKTHILIAAVVALGLLGIAAPLALADNVGAPTSAAGGLSAPSSPSLPPAAGPLSPTGGRGSSAGGSSVSEDYDPLKLQPPGTGKFEGPNNGTNTPCTGSTGFGSSNTQPGHKC
jgi:hypothetical protein